MNYFLSTIFVSGSIDAIQLELNYHGVRDSEISRKQFALKFVEVITEFIRAHYPSHLHFDLNYCSK